MVKCCNALVLLCCIPILVGCGSGMTIGGYVRVDGKPIEKGTISFTPVESGAGVAVAAQIEGGKYVARNIPLGRTLVQFHAQQETGKMVSSVDSDAAEGSLHPEVINLIPANYRKGIEITLVASEDVHNFDLSSP